MLRSHFELSFIDLLEVVGETSTCKNHKRLALALLL
jgi:hypothetical protein